MISAIAHAWTSIPHEAPKHVERPPPQAPDVARDAVRLSKEAERAAEDRNDGHHTSQS